MRRPAALSIRLEDDQHAGLDELAARVGLDKTTLARLAVEGLIKLVHDSGGLSLPLQVARPTDGMTAQEGI